jgi:hypothetical protein
VVITKTTGPTDLLAVPSTSTCAVQAGIKAQENSQFQRNLFRSFAIAETILLTFS